MAPSLNEMLASAMRMETMDEKSEPRLGEKETLNRLREHIVAIERPIPAFKRGDWVRFKPDLHMPFYSRENPVFVFFGMMDEPINPLDYVEGCREAMSPFMQYSRDCHILGLDDENEVVYLPVAAAWLELVE